MTKKWRANVTPAFKRFNIYLWGEFWPNFFWFSRWFFKNSHHWFSFVCTARNDPIQHGGGQVTWPRCGDVVVCCPGSSQPISAQSRVIFRSGPIRGQCLGLLKMHSRGCSRCLSSSSLSRSWGPGLGLTQRLEITPRHGRVGELYKEEEEDSSWHPPQGVTMESRWRRIFLTDSSLRLWVLWSESCVASATYSRPDPGAWAHQPWAQIPELFERFLDSESDDTEHSSKESKLCEILNVSVIILASSKHFINRVRKENILMKKVFTPLVFWSGHVEL